MYLFNSIFPCELYSGAKPPPLSPGDIFFIATQNGGIFEKIPPFFYLFPGISSFLQITLRQTVRLARELLL
ncbi:MAG: hypothetical protein HFF52_04985 [Lawsonibacter sp.]|nr:hypothetical protein [Lawsonibacter sp.]